MTDQFTQFDYLLNAFEQASQHAEPASQGYGEKRRALYAYVRDLESRTARSPDREAGSGTQHVCGKQGFGQRAGDVCPACTGEPDNV